MKNNKNDYNIGTRRKERQSIEDQIQAFLKEGGTIEVLNSPFDHNSDPKCRLGEETSFFN